MCSSDLAENLPFPDASFDVVLSTFGVMFAPDQVRAASELLRVVRPGGRIGLANWTPDGFVGQLFKVVGRFVPPPAGVAPPSLWGTRERIDQLFGSHATSMQATRRSFVFRELSAETWIDSFRDYYGPVHKAFAALDPAGQAALHGALIELLDSFDVGAGDGLVVPADYLEIVIRKEKP